jgi:imidazolonepropionase-like amidohydrolase/ABC-type multidrug transport system permease subunit
MNAYLAQIRMNLRLTLRNRMTVVFGYLMPLAYFVIIGHFTNPSGAAATQMVNMVLTLGVIGGGLFGAGMRAVTDRERNVLRRFKVAPIDAGPILVGQMATSLFNYLPLAALVIFLSHQMYDMPWPSQPLSLLLFITIGMLAFSSIGGIVAAVVNSMQESAMLTQLLYFPMLFLSGATFPIAIMPAWLQTAAQFIPATYFSGGLPGILRGKDTILDHLPETGSLALTALVATFLAVKLFRWEKEEKLRASAKLWLVAVLAPFLLMGAWQTHTKTNVAKAKSLMRDLERNTTYLIRDARVFVGDGTVIERASVLTKDGKIAEIFTGPAPDADTLKAEAIDAAGKTLLPGLIDVSVHLDEPGSASFNAVDYQNIDKDIDRELAAYLYSGVTTVKSAGDAMDQILKHRATIASGEKLGAELFVEGPMFTAAGGRGAEYAPDVPESARQQIEQQLVRLPKTPDEARAQVAELKSRGVDGIKVIREAGALDAVLLHVVGEAARAAGLPIVVRTSTPEDVSSALDPTVDGIEHGSMFEIIPEALFGRMKQMGVTFDPTLASIEATLDFAGRNTDPLDRTLVQQVVPRRLLDDTRTQVTLGRVDWRRPYRLDLAKQNLAAAYRAGVTLVPGTDSGNFLMFHGPGIHREMQLWVEAGVPPAVALQAATLNAARLLHADGRIGLIRQGYEASLLLVDGNPLQDISATERISSVFLKGERVNRQKLFDQK